jgi:hypothetical protein
MNKETEIRKMKQTLRQDEAQEMVIMRAKGGVTGNLWLNSLNAVEF